MSYIKLQGHYTEQTPGGLDLGTINQTVQLGNGTAVELPAPFLPINQHLAIAPVITADGDSAARIDFGRWSPLRYGGDGLAFFPCNFHRQDVAVRVARAFDADPAADWDDTYDQKIAWLHAWGDENGFRFA
ncbi:hypothetical protein [Amycolatopsis echigonensis]|uniref:Uncharacterized protein n=1 Tax=Amycolatopsis echigonensis TaxID=2576905 RepID=A0A2N3WEB3_9PSEU|nr:MULTISPECIES: hypothetical protein [Amycolatopsis]MBB2499650.1 hypothetical protein [Amycolatopsis echigonensis]PKV92191.1 hypothetical protein ATK30_2987 [Amycolatopsis niigatensis]